MLSILTSVNSNDFGCQWVSQEAQILSGICWNTFWLLSHGRHVYQTWTIAYPVRKDTFSIWLPNESCITNQHLERSAPASNVCGRMRRRTEFVILACPAPVPFSTNSNGTSFDNLFHDTFKTSPVAIVVYPKEEFESAP